MTTGMVFENVGVSGNQINMPVTCGSCGLEFDAAPEGGTYSTVAGRLVRVAQVIAGSSRDELAALNAQVQEIAKQQNRAAALDVARELGWEPPSKAKSKLVTGNEALDFIIKLQIVLAILLATGRWSLETVQQLLAQWVR